MQENNSEILLYKTQDGEIKIDVYFDADNLWLTQKLMAELFECSTDNISLHLKNIFKEEVDNMGLAIELEKTLSFQMGLEKGRKEGMKEGMKEGLLLVLQARFGKESVATNEIKSKLENIKETADLQELKKLVLEIDTITTFVEALDKMSYSNS